MTKELSEIALAFCREILGWPDARQYTGSDAVFHGHGGGRCQRFDLNFVMNAVRTWVNTMPGWFLQINSIEGTDKGWAVLVCAPDDDGVGDSNDLCEAMMVACLQAKSKVESIPE